MILLLIGAGLTAVWGVAHLIPTRSVVRGFGDVTADNRRIITMEWILEGVTLIWIGAVVAAVTLLDMASPVAKAVYALSAAGLLVFAGVSLFTGFKVNFLPFKLCPFIFTLSSLLILAGGLLQ